jgi:hypothetical protein
MGNKKAPISPRLVGGEREIRTPDRVAPITVFKCGLGVFQGVSLRFKKAYFETVCAASRLILVQRV